MAFAKVMVGTNVLIDCLNEGESFCRDARLLMIAANVGDVELWLCASQLTDLVYILSDGGKPELMAETLERLRVLRSFVRIAPVDSWCADRMLASVWKDPEDALVNEVALQIRADCIVTRDVYLQQHASCPAFDCTEFLAWHEKKTGISYAEVPV